MLVLELYNIAIMFYGPIIQVCSNLYQILHKITFSDSTALSIQLKLCICIFNKIIEVNS